MKTTSKETEREKLEAIIGEHVPELERIIDDILQECLIVFRADEPKVVDKATRSARREGLARDFSKYSDPYHSLSDGMRRAIDMIVELEEGAA